MKKKEKESRKLGNKGSGRGGRRDGAGRPKGDSRLYSFRAPGHLVSGIEAQKNKTEFFCASIERALSSVATSSAESAAGEVRKGEASAAGAMSSAMSAAVASSGAQSGEAASSSITGAMSSAISETAAAGEALKGEAEAANAEKTAGTGAISSAMSEAEATGAISSAMSAAAASSGAQSGEAASSSITGAMSEAEATGAMSSAISAAVASSGAQSSEAASSSITGAMSGAVAAGSTTAEQMATPSRMVPASRVATVELPFFDIKIVAGFPVPLDNDERSQDIDILRLLCPHPESSYLIRVNGDSMVDAGVISGDIVIVDKSRRTPTPREIAVCELNGEYTLKHVIEEDGRAWLVPANPDYPRIPVMEGDRFSIWGTVTYIIHKARG